MEELTLDGVLPINKEEGITSYDVIRNLKRFFPRKYKIGHAGTLDPFATGLLLILLGKATKLSDQIMHKDKVYLCTAQLGIQTDTQDTTGQIVRRQDVTSTDTLEKSISAALQKYTGKLMQTPPIYSAKKINGQKAYELARKGKEVNLQPREVTVYENRLIEFDIENLLFTFRTKVSSGTYIRTLVHDVGIELGYGATATKLCRESIGSFLLSDSVDSEKLDIDLIVKHTVPLDKIINKLN